MLSVDVPGLRLRFTSEAIHNSSLPIQCARVAPADKPDERFILEKTDCRAQLRRSRLVIAWIALLLSTLPVLEPKKYETTCVATVVSAPRM